LEVTKLSVRTCWMAEFTRETAHISDGEIKEKGMKAEETWF